MKKPKSALFIVDEEKNETCSIQIEAGRPLSEIILKLREINSHHIGYTMFSVHQCNQMEILVCNDPRENNQHHGFIQLGYDVYQITKAVYLSTICQYKDF